MTQPNEDDDSNALVKLFAKFNFSIDRLSEKIDRANKLEQQRLAALPNRVSIERLSLLAAGGTDLVDFGAPQPGRTWIVRLLLAIPTPFGANAAAVTWYVGQNIAGFAAGQLPGTSIRWQFPTIPDRQSFTSDVVAVKANQHLLAGVTNAPVNSSIALVALVNDQPEYAGAPVMVE